MKQPSSGPAGTRPVVPRADPAAPAVEKALVEARGHLQRGDREKALAVLDKAAATLPNDPRLAGRRGLIALQLGRVAEARGHLERAVAGGADDWQTRSALGAALAAAGRHAEAQQQFALALRIAPGHPVVLNNLGLALALQGKRSDAVRTLGEAQRAGSRADAPGAEARVKANLALLGGLKEQRAAQDGSARDGRGAVARLPTGAAD